MHQAVGRGACALRLLLFTALASSALVAQEARGSITGTVVDQSGSAIPGATVISRNAGTNVETKTTTNDSGIYLFPFLNTGSYSISVSTSGFKTQVRDNIDLTSTRIQLDFTLQIGDLVDRVTITAEAPLLETTNAIRSTVIDSKKVADLPLLGKNTYSLALFANGVLNINPQASVSNRPYDNGGMDALSINGGRAFTNEYLLDGAPNTNTERTRPGSLSFVPPPEATEEVRVVSNNYDAQYGRTGGGVISATLKSGTNEYHGALYEYHRNRILNANSFQANRQGQPRAPFLWNQPGATLHGPVILPKIYDGRNRTFFLFSWEGIYQNIPANPFHTVPTEAQRAGDFSGLRQANGQPIVIYDPLTAEQVGNSLIRQPFPNNRIPADRIDPVAQRLLAYMPLPNTTPDAAGFQNYAPTSGLAQRERYNAYTVKGDQVLTENHRFSLSYVRNRRHQTGQDFGWPTPVMGPNIFQRYNQGANTQFTSTLSPTLVLTSRFGFTRHIFGNEAYGGGFDPTPLGFPQSLISQAQGLFFPRIDFNANYTDFGGAGNSSENSVNWYYNGSATKVVRTHTFKFGGEYRVLFNNLPNYSFATFEFSSLWTRRDVNNADVGSGNDFATFLLGNPTGGNSPFNASPAWGSRYYGLFVQDDWRIARRLTVNLGARWDYESPYSERFNRQNTGFDLTSPSNLQVPGMQLRGGLQFASPDNRLVTKRDLNNFQPRLGLAWQFREKTVLRAGYGLSYTPSFVVGGTSGFSTTTPLVSSIDANRTPYRRLSNPFPEGLLRPTGSASGLSTFAGQGFTYVHSDRTVPSIHQFSLGFQQALPWQILVDASYVGSRSYGLGVNKNINAISAESLALGTTALNQVVPNPFAGLLPGTGLNGATTTRRQLLRPYPQFTDITRSELPIGKGWYNSLQVQMQKRLSAGFHLLVNYTYSATMEAAGYLYPQMRDDQLERVRTGEDLPHRVAVVGGYELPFPKTTKGWKRALFGGWQVQGILLAMSGRQLGGVDAYPTGVNPFIDSTRRPDAYYFNACTLTVAGVRQNCATPEQPAAWMIRPADTLRVTSSRWQNIREMRPPLLDSSLFKSFNPVEKMQVQLRFEAFNTFNTPWFGQATTDINNARFGRLGISQTNDQRNTQVALRITF